MDSATRGSRRVFLALSEPSPVSTRMRSPSRVTQTGADWGEPSGMIVARWAKFGPSKSRLTSSGSGIPTDVSFGSRADDRSLLQALHLRGPEMAPALPPGGQPGDIVLPKAS